MKNKHIVVLAGNYPATGHQSLVFVQELVHALIGQGVKVSVVAPQSVTHAMMRNQKLLPKHSTRQTDQGVIYNIYRPYIISAGNYKVLAKLTGCFNKLTLTYIVRKINPYILYAHFWSSALPIYEFAAANDIPLFVACGEGDDALEEMVHSLSDVKLGQLSSAVTGVISVSSENKRKCIEYGLAKDEDIEVFPNCVNTSIFHKLDVSGFRKQLGISDDDFVIGFVGGFIPRKGPDRIAKAITKLNDPHIKVMFIGKPFPGYPYDFDCPGIIYKGPLDHELLPQYVNCADVFVMPTQKEGCCNAIVEALAMGIPVISSNGTFNDDILDERNSIRLNPNNIDEIASAIKVLKDNSALRKQMSEYSLSRHHEYSIEGRAERILKFIEKQLDKISCW